MVSSNKSFYLVESSMYETIECRTLKEAKTERLILYKLGDAGMVRILKAEVLDE